MNCSEASALVVAYADGEVEGRQAEAIKQHVVSCANCAATIEAVHTLRARIRAEVPVYRAPPALRARVLAAASSGTPVPIRRERWRWLFSGVLAGCAATVLAWFIGTALIERRANQDLATEAVASHVRATLGNHLIEVASSDQHTVKPWLSARLDYSPPVRDMASAGFVLVGGRLDYLDGQHVATLVYRYRDHFVDVFVRPVTTRATASELRTLRGFNIARATGPAMEWVAVSDVSADVLSAFVMKLSNDG